ncbi:hypothetical protein SEA_SETTECANDELA_207 [Mycobacterium phage Settecandela]|nr:hypothetical protein SEA_SETTECANDELA_207 [Mycobacterium phage Settecandela]
MRGWFSGPTAGEVRRAELARQRDPHAHARIDALQTELSVILAEIIATLDPADGAADDVRKALKKRFADVDRRVAKDLGLPVRTRSGSLTTAHAP